MGHILKIQHLGPIERCEIKLNQFTVLTGPQSNGKSTVAKAAFFFRTVKQDILQIMMQGGPKAITGRDNAQWERVLSQKMKDKFLQLFGTSWVMPQDMYMEYTYKKDVTIRVSLADGDHDNVANYLRIEFSEKIRDDFAEYELTDYQNMNAAQKAYEIKRLNKLFNDQYETVFIPAGRNLITLLSTQLNYIFTSLEGSQLRNIDYVTKRYTELILKLKPLFTNGMDGLWAAEKNTIQRPTPIPSAIKLLLEDAHTVLCSKYKYIDGEERLYLDSNRYVKINLASSGQQEVVWVFNLLFYYLLENKKVFLILEEPESHLYPESQRIIGEVLSLFCNCGNSELITTHSPYLLGTFNYLLMAHQCPESYNEAIKGSVHKYKWLDPEDTSAYFICNGYLENAISEEEGIVLIQNERIDGAAKNINQISDLVLEQLWEAETDG